MLRLSIPPLRKRKEDIGGLFDYFLALYCDSFAYEPPHLLPDAREALCRYEFTGSVRELRNIAERISVLYHGETISRDDSLSALDLDAGGPECEKTVPVRMDSPSMIAAGKEESEKQLIRRVLNQAGGNRSQAARAMGVDRTTLWRKMKKYGILH